jgi:hypothetical protein
MAAMNWEEIDKDIKDQTDQLRQVVTAVSAGHQDLERMTNGVATHRRAARQLVAGAPRIVGQIRAQRVAFRRRLRLVQGCVGIIQVTGWLRWLLWLAGLGGEGNDSEDRW